MTVVDAQTISGLYEAPKLDIMGGDPGTVVSASATSIADGYGNLFTKTWYGPQGFTLYENITGDDRSDWAWTHSAYKVANKSISGASPDPATEMALLVQKQYQEIWGLSKRFYVPQNCYATIRIAADINTPPLNEWGVLEREKNYDGKTASETYLFINGVKIPYTRHLAREERIGTSPTGEYDFVIDSSLNSPTKNLMRRYYSCHYSVVLTQGWNEVQIKTDCRSERTYAARRSIHIDGTYV